jgi:hypothetical protein
VAESIATTRSPGYLVEPGVHRRPKAVHVCRLPRADSEAEDIYLESMFRVEASPSQSGAVWRCQCGQHWVERAGWWYPMSGWRARRVARKRKGADHG